MVLEDVFDVLIKTDVWLFGACLTSVWLSHPPNGCNFGNHRHSSNEDIGRLAIPVVALANDH
jgi:hypothetical protein